MTDVFNHHDLFGYCIVNWVSHPHFLLIINSLRGNMKEEAPEHGVDLDIRRTSILTRHKIDQHWV